ncbi:hypothetical protein M5689_009704 [Euphorbia peplus]|nr:hypothetical protein M5689_009704 [Euphorbia peplus]
MKRWWKLKSSYLSIKCIFLKLNSSLTQRVRARGKKNDGLRSLYKDMECCGGEYSDIQVMWNLVHSSTNLRSKRCHYFRFCFRPS